MSKLLGGSLVVEITPNVVKRYQADRLKEKAGPKTINDEVQLLLRLCGEQGALIRATLRRDKALKLALPPSPGRPYSTDEKARMLEEAQKLRIVRSPRVGFEHGSPGQGIAPDPVGADRLGPQEGAHGGQVENRGRHRARDPRHLQ